MGSGFSIRARRRTAAQQLALLQVKREISATDPHGRLKYVRDFSEAFRDYRRALRDTELKQQYAAADVLLVGDYHALPASQDFAASLIGQLTVGQFAQGNRPAVLALEMVFSRDQYVLDEWLRGEIGEEELRAGIRYDDEWGYDWEPFVRLLRQAKKFGCPVYGIDCGPRGNMRKLPVRDRHAAAEIAQIRRAHPEARVLTLFGEAHLAPGHLPFWLKAARSTDKILTVLQNIDELYWKLAGEYSDTLPPVEVGDGVLCVFNATPLEKYESYRVYISGFDAESDHPDFGPTFHNLVNTFFSSLGLEPYSTTGGNDRRTLTDEYPEVFTHVDARHFKRIMASRYTKTKYSELCHKLKRQGCAYLPKHNVLLVERFQMLGAAEEAVRFVQGKCRGKAFFDGPWSVSSPVHHFYFEIVDRALIAFGSRVLLPHYLLNREQDLCALLAQPREVIEGRTPFSYEHFIELIRFLSVRNGFKIAHQATAYQRRTMDMRLMAQGMHREILVAGLGTLLGGSIYEAYLSGTLTKSQLRSFFFRKLHLPGVAKKTYFEITRAIRFMTT